MTSEKLLNYEFLRLKDMPHTEKKFYFLRNLKVVDMSQFSPIEGEFLSELNKTYDVCLCKIHKRMLLKGFL